MMRFLISLFGLLFVLSGCAGPSAVSGSVHQSFEYSYSGSSYFVFFGRSIEAELGETVYVSDAQWTEFETTEIASRLNGYTVLDGLGGYTLPGTGALDPSVIRERTKVLIYVVEGCDVASSDTIISIAERYKKQFRQQAVLIVRVPSEVTVFE